MPIGFDPTILSNYYLAKLPLGSQQFASPLSQRSAAPLPPWDIRNKKPSQQSEDVTSRSSDPYFDPKLLKQLESSHTSGSDKSNSQIEALLKSRLSNNAGASGSLSGDNDKLFALYKALSRLDYIAKMANREGAVEGQRTGLDKSFQTGLDQVLSFVKDVPFGNLSVLPGQKTSTAQSTVSIAYPKTNYEGGAVVGDKQVFTAVPGLSASDKFTISVAKNGTTTDVLIDLANVTGTLSLDNINSYINQQLGNAGFATRFTRTQTGGSLVDRTATWGEKIDYRPGETLTLSSTQAKPAIYVAGMSGPAEDSAGKLIKLVGLDGPPSSAFAANIEPESGSASAKATAVDSNGNVYVIGSASGDFKNEINQADEDVFLTKLDSAGNVQWTKLLGAAEKADAYGLAFDPKSGGVVIAGSTTSELSAAALGGGTDSFVAKYDSSGNQIWLHQTAPTTDDQANAVSVDASGNIYVGGQVNGKIAAGQTNAGGVDAYVTKLDSTGKVLYQRQFGTTGTDAAMRTAVAADGNLVVASVQNGHAILSKYDSSSGSSAALWQVDLGDLQGGSIGGLTIAGGQVYVSGTSKNASLNASGAATIARASAGGTEAFVFSAADNGASATPDFISYVGTTASDQGGGVAVAGGKIYVTGTTLGTFAGQTRSVAGARNLFVAQLATNGALDWTKQYGGLAGESRGAAIAADASGASVLDALKLPRGKIDVNQSNAIESQTTARAGDYFTMQISVGEATRTAKITIAKGETLRSLALKINGALLFNGKATALPIKGGQGLKIAVNKGVQVQLIAGPKDLDALAGLGLKPQLLINDSKPDDSNNNLADDAGNEPRIVGLGINGGLDLLSKQGAAHAHVALQGAQSLIKQAYSQMNAPPQAPNAGPVGSAPAYVQTQLAGYQTALAWLSTINR